MTLEINMYGGPNKAGHLQLVPTITRAGRRTKRYSIRSVHKSHVNADHREIERRQLEERLIFC